MTNSSGPRTGLKTRGSGLSTARVILVASVWLAVVLVWNIWAAESAPPARGVAVLSVALLAAVATIRAELRKVAFTAWVLACVVAAFCYPKVFLKWGDLQMKTLIVPLIQVIMFGMGATLTVADFTRVIKMPRAVIVGTGLQFSIMPLLGFLLATAFGFEASVAVGIILVGSCPGGVASNVMTYLAKGNVALSVTLTACSTLVAPIMTPFFMKLFAGRWGARPPAGGSQPDKPWMMFPARNRTGAVRVASTTSSANPVVTVKKQGSTRFAGVSDLANLARSQSHPTWAKSAASLLLNSTAAIGWSLMRPGVAPFF